MQPLLGINPDGKLTLYINPLRELNEIGPRCERGVPFPADPKEINEENAMELLRDFQQYVDAHAEGTLRKRPDFKVKPTGRKATGLQSVRGKKFGDI